MLVPLIVMKSVILVCDPNNNAGTGPTCLKVATRCFKIMPTTRGYPVS
jgi:hypothetical protein